MSADASPAMSFVRALTLEGNTRVGEGSSWSLHVSGNGEITLALLGARGGAGISSQTTTTRVSAETVRGLFESLVTIFARHAADPGVLAGRSTAEVFPGPPRGAPQIVYALGRVDRHGFKAQEERVTVLGIRDRPILVLDAHPAFGEVRNAILNAGFVDRERDSYALRPRTT